MKHDVLETKFLHEVGTVVAAMGYKPEVGSEGWYDWYVKDELPRGFWNQHMSHCNMPTEHCIMEVANLPPDFSLNTMVAQRLKMRRVIAGTEAD